MSEVGAIGGAVVVVGLREDDNVVATTEGVFEDGSRAKVDIGVVTGSLVGGGTVKVPNTKLRDIGGGFCQSLGRGS